MIKGIRLNIFSQCKKYGLPLWQCPQLLFLMMGAVIIASILLAYFIGNRFIETPELVALVVILSAAALFVISYIIIHSFDRLAEVARLKSEFISIVSHQLRSPLSNLKWAADFLMSGRLGEIENKQAEYFKILKENSARMEQLISDLLIVSRIETATLPFIKKEVSLVDLAGKAAKAVKPYALASNVEIKISDAANLPRVFTDESQVVQVIEIFLDNAIRYISEKGEIALKIFKRKGNICVEVVDSGVGIPEADKKYIFQKFFRSANALRHQTEGSGLGLYIAKAIIKRSGGKIGFKSQEGKGSTFWFTLPIK
ncbi:MAG: HAMP domain-containing sensor histidine kinase [bacterium]